MARWDYATGDKYVLIEAVKGDDNDREVLGTIACIPLDKGFDAEVLAEAICREHNTDIDAFIDVLIERTLR